MAAFIANIAKGRFVELYNRVETGDPSSSRLVALALAATGLESDAVLADKDTLSDLLSGTTNEVTNTNYARLVLDSTDLDAWAPDDTNDRTDLPLPTLTFPLVEAGDEWAKIVICYHPNEAGGTDADAIPIGIYDFSKVPNGNDIVAVPNAAGFARAQ